MLSFLELPQWWACWADLALVPNSVRSAAHAEAEIDKALRSDSSTEEYRKAWQHRMGWSSSPLSSEPMVQAYLRHISLLVTSRTWGVCSSTAVGGLPPPGPGQLLAAPRAVVPHAVRGRISVVCPTSPARHHLHESLYRCFCTQEWEDRELVVLDTGGAPSPVFTSGSASSDPRVRYVHCREYPLTVGHKRNQLIQLASGELVAHFDDDNLYSPEYLLTMVDRLEASGAQLARVSAAFSWRPRANAPDPDLRWHPDLADRAEAFVHLHLPLAVFAFAHEAIGEEAGVAAVSVVHSVEDPFGIFLHVDHGGNVASYAKEKGSAAALDDIRNPRLRALLDRHRHFFV